MNASEIGATLLLIGAVIYPKKLKGLALEPVSVFATGIKLYIDDYKRSSKMDTYFPSDLYPERVCLFTPIEEIYETRTIKHPDIERAIAETTAAMGWPRYVYGKVTTKESSGLAQIMRTEPTKEGIKFYCQIPNEIKVGDHVCCEIASKNSNVTFHSFISERIKQ